jgi:small-conductance mechanosensitive channel
LGAGGAVLAFVLLVVGVILVERQDARIALQRQMDAVEADIELSADRLTRDLTQEVAVVQGLVALVSGQPTVDAGTFANYTRNFRRGRDNLRRVFLLRDGKILYSDRPPAGPESFARIERRLAPTEASARAAEQKGSVVMAGPFKTTENDDVFLYARPIFLGDGRASPAQFWGFAGINIDDDAIACPLGLCDSKPKYRMALRLVVDDVPQAPFTGDAALFEAPARAQIAFPSIPGVRIEIAALPADGWIEAAPHRWMIRGFGGALALFAGGLILMLATARSSGGVSARAWAAVGSAGVLLLVLGFAEVVDKFETEQRGHQLRGQIKLAATHATRDISDDVAVIQNLSTFVEADPNFTDTSFARYAERIRQLHPRIASVQLARDAKVSHLSPPDAERIGTDLRKDPADAAAIDKSIATGTPILAGPISVGHRTVFIYRQPIYIGDAPPSRDRMWGIATILMDRDAVVCPLGACVQPPKFRQALRLVTGQAPQPPFAGDAALFEAGSKAAKVAVHVPGGEVEMAAIPIEGWSEANNIHWIIWAIAIPLALIAAAKLLLVFFGLTTPILRVFVSLLIVMVGVVLALLRQDVAELLRVTGAPSDALVVPAIVTWIAFASAYTINTALSAFIWPAQSKDRIDSLQRAPSILRHFIAILLYTTAGLWVASYAFDLDLHGIGLTSGAAGIIIGFATQKIILDFFSGVMLGIERPFEIGDWIELKADGADLRGVVYEMTWRTAKIRNSNYDMVTIPNSVIWQATVINRSRPNRWTEITIHFDIGTDVAAERVEETAMRAIEPLIGDVLIAERKPSLRASAIQEGDIKYRLNVYAKLGPNSERPVQDKVVRALRAAFEAAGIEFSSTSATVLQLLTGANKAKDD